MLGANLRHLSKEAASISALCRDLGINRTQFNRNLSGESFPRPDVLHKICSFFGVDARVLLEPVDQINMIEHDLLHHPEIADYVGAGSTEVDEALMPAGFYRFSRLSFTDNNQFIQGLVYIYREDKYTFLRGYEAKEAMARQGLPSDANTREFRGFLLPQEGGVSAFVSRKNSLTTSFNFLARVESFEQNFWVGYATRTVRESVTGRRVARLVYEHLGHDVGKALDSARASGFCTEDQLVPYHRMQLRTEVPFT